MRQDGCKGGSIVGVAGRKERVGHYMQPRRKKDTAVGLLMLSSRAL